MGYLSPQCSRTGFTQCPRALYFSSPGGHLGPGLSQRWPKTKSVATEKAWDGEGAVISATVQKYPDLGLEGSVGRAGAGPSGRVGWQRQSVFISSEDLSLLAPYSSHLLTIALSSAPWSLA